MIVRSYRLVERIPLWVQLGVVALGYAVVVAIAAAFLYTRYLLALADPVSASGGMFAFGDLILDIFLVCLFLVPTFLLVWVASRFEAVYSVYSRFLFGLALTAPICLGVLVVGGNDLAQSLSDLCMSRLLWSPLVLVGIGFSRLVARFDRAKRLTTYALLVEGVTIGVSVAVVIHG